MYAIATDYHFLLIARIVTGIFGAVISSISYVIITDLFPIQQRGSVMGIAQMAFALSQVMGIPVGLYLANHFNWHAPFWMIVGLLIIVVLIITVYMIPIIEHLKSPSEKNVIQHLVYTITKRDYLKGFLATVMLATGGFMLMSFSSAFTTHNLGITLEDLPIVYGVTGVFLIIFGPIIGKLTDRVGKYPVFLIGSSISMIMVFVYTNMSVSALWLVVLVNVILFIGISSRMISSSALITGVPDVKDRGAFMSINSSIQQISGGIASAIAGLIVVQDSFGNIIHYDRLGYVIIITMIAVTYFMFKLNKQVQAKTNKQ